MGMLQREREGGRRIKNGKKELRGGEKIKGKNIHSYYWGHSAKNKYEMLFLLFLREGGGPWGKAMPCTDKSRIE